MHRAVYFQLCGIFLQEAIKDVPIEEIKENGEVNCKSSRFLLDDKLLIVPPVQVLVTVKNSLHLL